MERLIATDFVGGALEKVWFDDATETVRVEHVTDTKAVLDDVAQIRKTTGGKSKSGELWHVGSIDLTLWGIWAAQRGIPADGIYKPEYEAEVFRFITEHPLLSPTEGKF